MPGPKTNLTLLAAIREHAARAPEAPALLAPGRRPLTYTGLSAQIDRAARQYQALGVGRGDTAALMVGNGPELAAALASTLACATAAPLNPAQTPDELAQALTSLRARALVLAADDHGPAAAVADRLGVAVLRLAHDPAAPAGTFDLSGAPQARRGPSGPAQPDDMALMSFTSGTTGRPKRVPMPYKTLSLAAAYYAQSLELSASDRCLNIMPLFHAHGIVAVLLATLTAGGSVICTPGFQAARFFEWMSEGQPTWYSAVPALHQAVLARAAEAPELVGRIRPLRMIRSASATLPARVRDDLERTFGAPVVEGYGITETNLVTGTSPRASRPGSVGRPIGCEVGIMTPGTGELLPPGATGEVVVRGPMLFPGYADDPEATASACAQGWFHTGDQGYLDEDGYLFLNGRLKELISRGAEKVAPAEVEEALLRHPAVAEAVVFGIPEARLGEVVGAAVVARAGREATERELRRFVAEKLSYAKVPARIAVVAALPRGPAGKVLRAGLAERLGLSGAAGPAERAPYEPPASELEARLAALWESVLARERVGRHDRFLDLGGDSLLAAQLVARVASAVGLELTMVDFFDAPTVAQQAEMVRGLQRAAADDPGATAQLEYGTV